MVPQQQQGYGPPQGMPGQTVLGLPLEPGERVIWFKKHDYTMDKIIYIVMGVLLLVILIGVIFIYLGATMDSRRPQAHALTNRRVIIFGPPGKGAPQIFPLSYVADLVPTRQKSGGGGGGLIGMAVGAAINAAINYSANQQHKLTKDFWNRTIRIDIVYQNGQKAVIPCELDYGRDLGMMMARAVLNNEAETLPAVQQLPA